MVPESDTSSFKHTRDWVIAKLKAGGGHFSGLDLSNLDLHGINFNIREKQINFQNADLSNTNLQGCTFTNVDFTGAKLIYANLRDCVFDTVSFTDANLTRADLDGIVCSNCTFANALLDWAWLNDCSVGFLPEFFNTIKLSPGCGAYAALRGNEIVPFYWSQNPLAKPMPDPLGHRYVGRKAERDREKNELATKKKEEKRGETPSMQKEASVTNSNNDADAIELGWDWSETLPACTWRLRGFSAFKTEEEAVEHALQHGAESIYTYQVCCHNVKKYVKKAIFVPEEAAVDTANKKTPPPPPPPPGRVPSKS